jgi:hypothetical protein
MTMNTTPEFIRCTLTTDDEIYININSISTLAEEERIDKDKVTAIYIRSSDNPVIVRESVGQVLTMIASFK